MLVFVRLKLFWASWSFTVYSIQTHLLCLTYSAYLCACMCLFVHEPTKINKKAWRWDCPADAISVWQTYDVRRIPAHGDDCPVYCPQQLLHDNLNMPLGGTLRRWDNGISIRIETSQQRKMIKQYKKLKFIGCVRVNYFFIMQT